MKSNVNAKPSNMNKGPGAQNIFRSEDGVRFLYFYELSFVYRNGSSC